MKILVIFVITLVCQATSDEQISESSIQTQIERNEINVHKVDEEAIMNLSTRVNEVTLSLVRIVKSIGSIYADDLENLTRPLADIISFMWNTPMDESFQSNLYFFFDKILDIVYCMYEVLDEVWDGSTHIIESKLSQISQFILRILDELKTLSQNEYGIEFDENLANFKKTVVELTVSLVGLTSVITSIAELVTTRERKVFLIVGTISSLIIIHQYALSAVVCLISPAVKVIDSLDIIHSVGIDAFADKVMNFLLSLKPIVENSFKQTTNSTETTITRLFNGDLHSELSIQLIASSSNRFLDDQVFKMIQSTTSSLSNILKDSVPEGLHILPDLIDQLPGILIQCSRTELSKLERFITYAFDGLHDVLNHISYRLDKHIQSSASTGSFMEPSEPIDVTVANVRTLVKRFIKGTQHSPGFKFTESNRQELIVGTVEFMKALLDPMDIVLHKSNSDTKLIVTLASSLQFIALYVVGLVVTPLMASRNISQTFIEDNKIHSNFTAALTLALIKVQIICEYSGKEDTLESLKFVYNSFHDLLEDLLRLNVDFNSLSKAAFVKVTAPISLL